MTTNDVKPLPGEHPLEHACRVSAESRLHYGVATSSDTFDPNDVAAILKELDAARARIAEMERAQCIRSLPYPAPAEKPESDADLPTHEDVRGLLKKERCPLCGEADDELCSHGFHAPAPSVADLWRNSKPLDAPDDPRPRCPHHRLTPECPYCAAGVGEDGSPELRCHDCGLPYKDWRFADFVVSDNVWAQIGPTGGEGGILCVNCMVGRCRQEGLVDPQAGFTSGPFVDDGKPAHPAIWRERALAAEADAARLREALERIGSGNCCGLGEDTDEAAWFEAELTAAQNIARSALSPEAKTTEGE